MYEGAPNQPGARPLLADDRPPRVTILYTAPTAIRAFMRWGDNYVKKHTSIRSACSAPSANRSIPRRGCGTTP
jgi:acyl-coenzyme A synthetase/AMP-(fatty) acid ligase